MDIGHAKLLAISIVMDYFSDFTTISISSSYCTLFTGFRFKLRFSFTALLELSKAF